MDEKNETGSAAPEMPGKQPPLRRVGSFTLGVCLIAAGIFFLLTYFVPGFPTQPVFRIVPAAGLVMLGGEVLFFAARPGRWKYDFWSVLICLVLMGGCFGLSLLPVVWDELGPERDQASMKLSQQYTADAYAQIRKSDPDAPVKDISGNVYLYTGAVKTLEDIDGGSGYVTLDVELSGSYGSAEQFAQACRSMTDAVQQCRPQPDTLIFAWSPDNDPEESLGTGTLQQVERYTLKLVGIAQLDWTADQMAKQTEIQYLLDEENEETAESEAFSEESAELSE
ncbi:hypothetical protein ACKXF7_06055 [Faecalibacterium sp. 7]|uniref:hypothetical protein n=1 Tax=Faecalibacterium sp. 7 TaxID=3402017 RepID=UPI003C2DFA47